jgi:flavin-dependent dehydrogenase
VWDLLILGAGPAGCAAAIQARRAGLRVIVIEVDWRERSAPGETLHPGAEPILDLLGVRDRIHAENFHRHRGIWVEWDKPGSFEAYGEDEHGPWLGFQAERARLNDILRSTLLALGAEFVNSSLPESAIVDRGVVRGVIVNSTRYHAKWTVDATGRKTWLAGKLQLAKVISSPPMFARFGWRDTQSAELDGAPRLRAEPRGWSWLAPLGGGRSAWVDLEVAGTSAVCLGADVSWRIFPDCAGPGYFLIGDAAAVVDPLSSHGVLRALMSGILCGHLISAHHISGVAATDVIHQYSLWIGQQFGFDIAALTEFYRRHPSPEIANIFGAIDVGTRYPQSARLG